ncbi:CocE/NonD family hydrolase [Streptomyces sp. 7N604]|uniref:CocE/NonD family hydrolase n=1 Tax=Streptomyces sp. 7N604 TaxID=3457415 RepID=UPI003FCF18B7
MRARTAAVIAGALALVLGVLLAPSAASETPTPTIEHHVIHSFDGVPIYSTLFLPPGASSHHPVPLVMRTHGWGGTGQTELDTGTLSKLVHDGYAVLTWDSRGFGKSGGETHVNAPNVERLDASALLDWATQRPEIKKERPGDPIVGFSGGSYAGGIQLVTAAFDERIDAIAPEITWHDLRYSLFPHNVVKSGWDELLFELGFATALTRGLNPTNETGIQTGSYSNDLQQAHADLLVNNGPSESTNQFFKSRSMAGYSDKHPVDVPTLLMQGSVDTLFNINEAVSNFRHVRSQHAPSKLIVYCGGHVACPDSYTPVDDRAHLDQAILTWFDRYLKGNRQTGTGPAVEYRTNTHGFRGLTDVPTSASVTGGGSGSLVGTGVPTSGRGLTATPSQPGDPTALTVPIVTAPAGGMELFGMPKATLSLTGTGAPAADLFLKLVDRESGEVVNLQEQAVRVEELSTHPRQLSLDLSGVAYSLPAGHHLDLQVATSSASYAAPRSGPVRLGVEVNVSVPTPPR